MKEGVYEWREEGIKKERREEGKNDNLGGDHFRDSEWDI